MPDSEQIQLYAQLKEISARLTALSEVDKEGDKGEEDFKKLYISIENLGKAVLGKKFASVSDLSQWPKGDPDPIARHVNEIKRAILIVDAVLQLVANNDKVGTMSPGELAEKLGENYDAFIAQDKEAHAITQKVISLKVLRCVRDNGAHAQVCQRLSDLETSLGHTTGPHEPQVEDLASDIVDSPEIFVQRWLAEHPNVDVAKNLPVRQKLADLFIEQSQTNLAVQHHLSEITLAAREAGVSEANPQGVAQIAIVILAGKHNALPDETYVQLLDENSQVNSASLKARLNPIISRYQTPTNSVRSPLIEEIPSLAGSLDISSLSESLSDLGQLPPEERQAYIQDNFPDLNASEKETIAIKVQQYTAAGINPGFVASDIAEAIASNSLSLSSSATILPQKALVQAVVSQSYPDGLAKIISTQTPDELNAVVKTLPAQVQKDIAAGLVIYQKETTPIHNEDLSRQITTVLATGLPKELKITAITALLPKDVIHPQQLAEALVNSRVAPSNISRTPPLQAAVVAAGASATAQAVEGDQRDKAVEIYTQLTNRGEFSLAEFGNQLKAANIPHPDSIVQAVDSAHTQVGTSLIYAPVTNFAAASSLSIILNKDTVKQAANPLEEAMKLAQRDDTLRFVAPAQVRAAAAQILANRDSLTVSQLTQTLTPPVDPKRHSIAIQSAMAHLSPTEKAYFTATYEAKAQAGEPPVAAFWQAALGSKIPESKRKTLLDKYRGETNEHIFLGPQTAATWVQVINLPEVRQAPPENQLSTAIKLAKNRPELQKYSPAQLETSAKAAIDSSHELSATTIERFLKTNPAPLLSTTSPTASITRSASNASMYRTVLQDKLKLDNATIKIVDVGLVSALVQNTSEATQVIVMGDAIRYQIVNSRTTPERLKAQLLNLENMTDSDKKQLVNLLPKKTSLTVKNLPEFIQHYDNLSPATKESISRLLQSPTNAARTISAALGDSPELAKRFTQQNLGPQIHVLTAWANRTDKDLYAATRGQGPATARQPQTPLQNFQSSTLLALTHLREQIANESDFNTSRSKQKLVADIDKLIKNPEIIKWRQLQQTFAAQASRLDPSNPQTVFAPRGQITQFSSWLTQLKPSQLKNIPTEYIKSLNNTLQSLSSNLNFQSLVARFNPQNLTSMIKNFAGFTGKDLTIARGKSSFIYKSGAKAYSKFASSALGKAIGGAITKIATKLGLQGLLQSVGSLAPGIGNAIAFVLGLVMDKFVGVINKMTGGLIDKVQDYAQDSIKAGALLSTGVIGGAVAGVAAFVTGTLALFVGWVVTAALSAIVSSIAIILSLPIVVAFFIAIITNSAYITPPSTVNISGSQNSQVGQNEYMKVEKAAYINNVVIFAPVSNTQLPTNVTYKITVSALKEPLTQLKLVNSYTVTQKSPQTATPPNPSVGFPNNLTINPGLPYTLEYSVVYDSKFNDSIVTDNAEVTATLGSGQTTSTTGVASIIFGQPPTECFVFDNSWSSAPAYKAKLQEQLLYLSSAHSGYVAKICAGGTTTLKYGGAGVYNGFCPSSPGNVCTFYDQLLQRDASSVYYTLTHELGHRLNWVNPGLFAAFVQNVHCQNGETVASGACENFLPSYAFYHNGSTNLTEDFAETAAWFAEKARYNFCPIPQACYRDMDKNFPKHYQFAQTQIMN